MDIKRTGKPGRPKGAKNKRTKAVEAAIARAGITPLEFMMNMLRDEGAPLDDRKWAAQSAAPYVHAKLTAADVTVEATHRFDEAIGSAIGLVEKLRQQVP